MVQDSCANDLIKTFIELSNFFQRKPSKLKIVQIMLFFQSPRLCETSFADINSYDSSLRPIHGISGSLVATAARYEH